MTPMVAAHPDCDPELSNSDRWIYKCIAERAPVTRQCLLEETDAAPRTLDRALTRLEERGYIVLVRDSGDLRQIVAMLAGARTSNHSER